MKRFTQRELSEMKKRNELRERLDALALPDAEAETKADLFRFLLGVNALNSSGLRIAEDWVLIQEKYWKKTA